MNAVGTLNVCYSTVFDELSRFVLWSTAVRLLHQSWRLSAGVSVCLNKTIRIKAAGLTLISESRTSCVCVFWQVRGQTHSLPLYFGTQRMVGGSPLMLKCFPSNCAHCSSLKSLRPRGHGSVLHERNFILRPTQKRPPFLGLRAIKRFVLLQFERMNVCLISL